MDDVKEFRRHALECARLSEKAPSPEAKEHFAALSKSWLRIADEIECGDRLLTLLDDIEPLEEAA